MTNRTIIHEEVVHVRTEEQYNLLMILLEKIGCQWITGRLPTSIFSPVTFIKYGNRTCVRIRSGKMDFSPIKYYSGNLPITAFEDFYKRYQTNHHKSNNLNSRLIKCIDEVYKINQ